MSRRKNDILKIPSKKTNQSSLRSVGIGGGNDFNVRIGGDSNDDETVDPPNDNFNYALLIVLYTLQGIPLGLSASIPFLIQQKVKALAVASAAAATTFSSGDSSATVSAGVNAAAAAAAASANSYNAQAIFALCSWPFSLKLLWAPIVDAIFWKRMGRRKSWLVPVQFCAGMLMVAGSGFVESCLGLEIEDMGVGGGVNGAVGDLDVRGMTAFFFALYFLMATQDVAVDGWALTMLSRENRGKGPICNSIGQNLGYFMAFVGFLALNDAETSETVWRPILGLKSNPGKGVVSLGGFIRFMGFAMIVVTVLVALFKREDGAGVNTSSRNGSYRVQDKINGDMQNENGHIPKRQNENDNDNNEMNDDEDGELDAYEIGLAETYRRIWAVCKLPAVRSLFIVLLTYRLPTALSDNVKFLKAVEYGMSKQAAALLTPAIVLPLGILVPIVAAKVWHGKPLRQFTDSYLPRVTLIPILDACMLLTIRAYGNSIGENSKGRKMLWSFVVASTAGQAIVHSLGHNALMTFFASRVDPTIGGSYMTLLNTVCNLGGTWPSSIVMYLVGRLTSPPTCQTGTEGEICTGGRDGYFPIQAVLSLLGCTWIYFLYGSVRRLEALPGHFWRTGGEAKKIDKNN